MISVIDYGVTNIGSLLNMLRKCGIEARVVSTPVEVLSSEKLVLPGVGSFDNGVLHLRELKLEEPIIKSVEDLGTPILGICLGMQLLGNGSDEGELPGLGLINARSERFNFPRESQWKVPHQGWNQPTLLKPSPLLNVVDRRTRFYFTHSFHLVCRDVSDILATACYGIDFTAMIERDQVRGVQFHPEKSHSFGMALLKNYAEL